MPYIDLILNGAHVRFTDRAGGVSTADFATLNLGPSVGDVPEAVRENLRRAADGLPVAQAKQVHGIGVREVDAASEPSAEADGLATTATDLALVVTTADCLPVALASEHAVAMLHAGWRGLADGMLETGVNAIASLDPGSPIEAAIGPGAGACCYEVSDDVAGCFPDWAFSDRRLDLKAVAASRLHAVGVRGIDDVACCTMCEPDRFYSHRRSGPTTGRQGGLVWRRSSEG